MCFGSIRICRKISCIRFNDAKWKIKESLYDIWFTLVFHIVTIILSVPIHNIKKNHTSNSFSVNSFPDTKPISYVDRNRWQAVQYVALIFGNRLSLFFIYMLLMFSCVQTWLLVSFHMIVQEHFNLKSYIYLEYHFVRVFWIVIYNFESNYIILSFLTVFFIHDMVHRVIVFLNVLFRYSKNNRYNERCNNSGAYCYAHIFLSILKDLFHGNFYLNFKFPNSCRTYGYL